MNTDNKILCVVSAVALLMGAAQGQLFDAASIEPSTAGEGISCSGGPGTADPTLWRCSGMPLGLVISKAFRFEEFQFSTHDPCCLARFDFRVRVPAGSTGEQFDRMLQDLLRERFRLAFHYQRKEMPIYELRVASQGRKLKQSPPGGRVDSDPWWVFSADGSNKLSSLAGHFRWTASGVSAADIAKTLSDQTGRPVVDRTGLQGRYDVDLKWTLDLDFALSERSKAEIREQVGELPDSGGGPTLIRAVESQLGLKLKSAKGPGEIVVIDHVEKVPTAN